MSRPMMPVPDREADPGSLAGRWSLRRRLRDDRVGMSGRVLGVLLIRPDAQGALHWEEAGELHWGSLRTPVRRHTILRRTEDGWWMTFEHGGLFHPWRPGAVVEHTCAADLYRGMVRIDGADRMRVLWCVRGPGKDQRLMTGLRRIG